VFSRGNPLYAKLEVGLQQIACDTTAQRRQIECRRGRF
jgi:hypothetical protein